MFAQQSAAVQPLLSLVLLMESSIACSSSIILGASIFNYGLVCTDPETLDDGVFLYAANGPPLRHDSVFFLRTLHSPRLEFLHSASVKLFFFQTFWNQNSTQQKQDNILFYGNKTQVQIKIITLKVHPWQTKTWRTLVCKWRLSLFMMWD